MKRRSVHQEIRRRGQRSFRLHAVTRARFHSGPPVTRQNYNYIRLHFCALARTRCLRVKLRKANDIRRSAARGDSSSHEKS